MTETKLPEELEEQAMLYAIGVLDPEDYQAFEMRLQGESDLLRQTVRVYRMVTSALADAVAPVTSPVVLRERLIHQTLLEANREAEQFEIIANTLAIGSVPVKPRDAVRKRLLSRIEAQSDVRLEAADSMHRLGEASGIVGDGNKRGQERCSLQDGGSFSDWLRPWRTAVANFLRTLVIRSMIPRPSSDGLTFVKASEGTWREIAHGVTAKLLAFDPVSRRTTTLLRFLPGTSYAPHRHAAVEELYVLEGGCSIAGREMAVGDYHRAEAGTVHHDTSTEDGCLLLVISSPQNELLK